jgi:uncharacterized membrane protein
MVKMQDHIQWMKLMLYGEKLGCHQRPDRSFFINGYQMPVCARCTGVMIGYLLAFPLFFLHSFSWLVSLAGCGSLLLDWGLQAMKLKNSSNTRRLLTGLSGGYGLMSIQLWLISLIIRCIGRKA